MLIYKIIVIGVIGAFLSALIKQHRPDLAIAVPILVSIAILSACVPYIEGLVSMLSDIADKAGIEISRVEIVFKIIGIAYICQFGADICADAGEKSIASKIELGGKLTIVILSMPIIYSLLDLVSDIINF